MIISTFTMLRKSNTNLKRNICNKNRYATKIGLRNTEIPVKIVISTASDFNHFCFHEKNN